MLGAVTSFVVAFIPLAKHIPQIALDTVEIEISQVILSLRETPAFNVSKKLTQIDIQVLVRICNSK